MNIREGKDSRFFIENLIVVVRPRTCLVLIVQRGGSFNRDFAQECSTVQDLMEVFAEGVRNRTVGTHALNKDSSRSHGILVLFLDSHEVDEDTGEVVTNYGKVRGSSVCVSIPFSLLRDTSHSYPLW